MEHLIKTLKYLKQTVSTPF